MTHHTVYSQNFVAFYQIATGRLAIVHDPFDEYAQRTARTVIAADDREAQRLSAWSLFEEHCMEGVGMTLLETIHAIPLPRNSAEVLR